MKGALLAVVFCLATPCLAQKPDSRSADVLLEAMREELGRSRALKVVGLESPYYIAYGLDDGETLSTAATLGGLISSRRTRFRLPRIDVRVGDYKFDNSNFISSGALFGSRYNIDPFPLENVHPTLRRYFWLAADQAYKSALEAIARKRAALKSISVVEQIPDFYRAEPTRLLEDIRTEQIEESTWTERVRSLSSVFLQYPQIKASTVEVQAARDTRYLVTSEGTEVRVPEHMLVLRARVMGQAPDGMLVRDTLAFHTLNLHQLAPEPEIRRGLTALADNVTRLTRAPVGENYSGPVLFEGVAAAQVFAEVLGRNLALTRKPITEPGYPGAFPASELENRLNARILPEWIDVVDDPTLPLFGHYAVDQEGVKPKPLRVVEKGILTSFLLTRQGVKSFNRSNGRARLPGTFGASTPAISNLLVQASQGASRAELKQKLIEFGRARNRPYGMIVRKMDFPSSASVEEVQRSLSRSAQSGGSSHPVSLPLLISRVYPDGREELVRGLRFQALNVRSLRDILATGNDRNVFEFLENSAPFALMGYGTFAAESCVVAPSILFEDLELVKVDDQQPKLPIVPPPT